MFEKLREGLSGLISKIAITELKAEHLRPILWDFKLTLIEADVAVSVADHICESIEKQLEGIQVKRLEDRRGIVERSLHKALLDILTTSERIDLLGALEKKRRTKKPLIIIFVGLHGTGKTTTIAKIAKFLMKHGYSVVLACSDTYRAGSIEQLEEHAKRLGVRMIKHQYGADAAAVAFDAVRYAEAHGINAVLIDTAGRMQTNINLMREMEKIVKVIGPDLVLFVGDALTGNDAVMQAQEFDKFVHISGSILAKVDADAKGGAAISITHVTKKPIIFLGVGQKYEDLEAFKPETLVKRILGS
ncbi:MAG: Signal recognition particle 54 kDa protein [Candidatus Bathyarchaeota archaeon BA1]|nr:MAG: Signal recognition particle 54 kDa protein [Candidatus Bathyarchaeota archaeon BA1]